VQKELPVRKRAGGSFLILKFLKLKYIKFSGAGIKKQADLQLENRLFVLVV
jgi:hypothetical protein